MDDRTAHDFARADDPHPDQVPSPAEAAPSATRTISAGDVLLGKYRVEHELGKGGMGVVLAVRHLELDEVFAFKVLLPGAAEGREAVDRFIREAKVMARLRSEHTAKVFDVGRMDPDRPYMIMEYLHGTDLRKVLAERGALGIDEAVAHVLEACEAIGAAHAQGIVHRDIKPSNLFLAERSSGKPCIKVIDFGISKMLAPDGADLTGSGVVLGSPLYMSPEQMMRSKNVGMTTDVWALGCVLYELVTGRAPFRAESLTAIVGRVLTHEPPPPSSLRAEVPGWLDAAILRCLRKAPEDRYHTVDELAFTLREGERAPRTLAWGEEAPVPRSPRASADAVSTAREAAPPTGTVRSEPLAGALEHSDERGQPASALAPAPPEAEEIEGVDVHMGGRGTAAPAPLAKQHAGRQRRSLSIAAMLGFVFLVLLSVRAGLSRSSQQGADPMQRPPPSATASGSAPPLASVEPGETAVRSPSTNPSIPAAVSATAAERPREPIPGTTSLTTAQPPRVPSPRASGTGTTSAKSLPDTAPAASVTRAGAAGSSAAGTVSASPSAPATTVSPPAGNRYPGVD